MVTHFKMSNTSWQHHTPGLHVFADLADLPSPWSQNSRGRPRAGARLPFAAAPIPLLLFPESLLVPP